MGKYLLFSSKALLSPYLLYLFFFILFLLKCTLSGIEEASQFHWLFSIVHLFPYLYCKPDYIFISAVTLVNSTYLGLDFVLSFIHLPLIANVTGFECELNKLGILFGCLVSWLNNVVAFVFLCSCDRMSPPAQGVPEPVISLA